ncbi:MAG TPA: TonB-dependent receptor [Puia sp.]|nr:TonB-dependent receptor [Puia sp.]
MKKCIAASYVCNVHSLKHLPGIGFKKFIFLLVILFLGVIVSAQNKLHVTGVVTNDNGTPLADCSVTVKGNAAGTKTDSKGMFSMDVPDSKSVLVISYVGYQTLEIPVGKTTSFAIKLTSGNASLADVVVVGYGTQKRTSITAAVATINGDEIASQPVADLSNSLGGRATGIIFTQGSGEPGYDGSNILIRGISTTGNAQPLVIVDGIPRNFSQLDPNSIASISILKDAAAVAPYGMGGANGVILITTKKGKTGAPTLTYNAYVGWQNPTRLTKFVNAYQFATLFNAADDNEGAPHAYSDYALQKYKDHSAPDLYPDHNVLKELITPNTIITNHNLEFSGGAERIKYYAGIGFLSQNGMWGPTKYKRYNLTANIEADATKTTKVNVSLNGRVEDRRFPGVSSGSIFYQAFRTPPNAPLTFSNGLPGSYIGRSAYGNIFGSGYTQTVGYTLLNQISIEQQLPFVKGLSVKALVSYDFNPFNPTDPGNPFAPITTFNRTWLTPILYYNYDSATNSYPQSGNDGPAKPQYSESYYQSQAFTYQAYLNYHNNFGKSEVTGLIVLEARNTKSSVFGAGRVNYSVNVPELNNGSSNSTDISNYGYSAESKQKSAVYRVTYGYAGKYLVEASGRYDGNYYFAPNHRFGFFPAFAAGWRLSEEGFIKNKFPWITNLKIRGSYGESGALAGSPFQYLSSYTLYGNASVLNGTTTQGLYENSEANTNITWERAKKTDVGIESNFWNGLLTVEADYFYEKRTDMLFPPTVTVPLEYGVALAQVNSGAMSNRGFELSVGSTRHFSKDLTVSLKTNFTFARNKLLQVFETDATFKNPNRRKTGRPLGTQFGYKAIGYFTQDDFNPDGTLKAGIPTQAFSTTLHPGDIKYADVSSPGGGKPDGMITPDDIVPIGHPATPEIIYGIIPSVAYKGFDLSLLFQGASSRDFYMSVFAFDNSSSAIIDALDYWTPTHPNAVYPRITTQPTPNNTQTSSWWIRNGAYFRLKTGELGYTLPITVIRSIKIQSARFYLSGQNLLTWSKIKNFDPEISSSTGQYYPQQKVISIGLNVTF